MHIAKDMMKLADAPKAASVAAAGTLASGWIAVGGYGAVHTVVGIGSGAGTPAITYEQATDSGGTGAKALAWDAGTFATDRTEVTNNPNALDVAGGFTHVRATVTITGGAGTVTSLNVHGVSPRHIA